MFCHLWKGYLLESGLTTPSEYRCTAVWKLCWAAVWKRLYSCQVSWHLSPQHTHSSEESRIRAVAWKSLLREMGVGRAHLHYWSEGVTNGKFRYALSICHRETSQTWKAFCQVIKLVVTCLTDTVTQYIRSFPFSTDSRL